MSRKPTRDDVARLAGTSTAVVSYVVNGGPRRVREETRQRVLRAIGELGYRPNALAKSLSHGRTDLYALLVPDLANPYLAALAQALEHEFFARGKVLLVGDSHDDPDRETLILEAFLRQQIAGLVWYGVNQPLPLDLLEESHVPAVLLNQPTGPPQNGSCAVGLSGRPGIWSVSADERLEGRLATKHLVDHGRRTIAIVAGPNGRRNARERVRGWEKALRRADLPSSAPIHVPFTREGGRASVDHVLELGADAVVASNEMQAIGLLNGLHLRGVRVPEDIAIIGINGTPLAEYASPSLSMVEIPAPAVADRIARALNGEGDAGGAAIAPYVVARASCGCGNASERIEDGAP